MMRTTLLLLLTIAAMGCRSRNSDSNTDSAMNLIKVGDFQSRAFLYSPEDATAEKPAPAIVLLPGSGEFGPEEMLPKVVPPTGTDGYPYLTLFAQSFQKAGFHTLQLGKPGVEVFTTWEAFLKQENFYDRDLWNRLTWQDMLTNARTAIDLLRKNPAVDSSRIYVLGHSEGTVVASDVATSDPTIAGVVLLGYAGEPIAKILHWQIFERQFELLIEPDVDADHNGSIDESEAKAWPKEAVFPPSMLSQEKPWNWQEKPVLPISTLKEMWASDPLLVDAAKHETVKKRFPFWDDEFWNRGNIHASTAAIAGKVFVFTGDRDTKTPEAYALALKAQCEKVGKQNCEVNILPGLTHTFAPINTIPMGPKLNILLDEGHNPPDEGFFTKLYELAKSLAGGK